MLLGVLMALGINMNAQTSLPPTQTDEIIIDNGATGKADAIDRIRYKVTIVNTGTSNANIKSIRALWTLCYRSTVAQQALKIC